ncbi:RebB family R body protein [Chryseobacterium tongliaoense]|uniref:RebB family R body protein n=1 Tax=Chryseobacterium tongliaoense TaxID=3240933 RepID=UPI0035165F3F
MENNRNEVNTEVVGMSAAVTSAMNMQVSAHSTGLMFEQSVANQQKDFLVSLSNSVMGYKKVLGRKLRYEEAAALRKSRFGD